MKFKNSPFLIEKYRAKLASENNLHKLVKTYDKSFTEIKDMNTSNLWDYLNMTTCDYIPNKNPMAANRIEIVSKFIKGNNINVLNIGIGSASLENVLLDDSLKNREINWTGIDISTKSILNAKKNYPNGLFKVGNILDIKFRDGVFDYVIVLEVLEHIRPSDTFRALYEIMRVLKSNGKLIISVPLNERLEEMITKGFNPNAHVRVYTPYLIKAELNIVGLEIVKEQYLYAFHKFYNVKKMLTKYLLKNYKHPNNIILVAKKP